MHISDTVMELVRVGTRLNDNKKGWPLFLQYPGKEKDCKFLFSRQNTEILEMDSIGSEKEESSMEERLVNLMRTAVEAHDSSAKIFAIIFAFSIR
ncbi:uncharacterized protein LOC131075954 [Cryptomeria japonica]|uniref:uncharacterized protein LOC131075954 n=1 Tax=Cryptomeria japonica TaxID=3369 RepID=UPI0027DA3A89|nr:uncharacterized protein LOC131075954 [Cryptomeria japonica]